ncbi:MAG: single-stranded DNA-binding protein [bacterium]|nr:single-stranded DNA-binding protein [bacterium]
MNLNKVFIIGRLTQDPQLRSTPSGQQVATLSMATNRTWTDKLGARQEAVEYHTVVVWGRQAAVASQFLKKGSMTLIEGRLQTRSWQDNQGQTRKTTEIVAERLQLGPRPQGGGDSFGAMPKSRGLSGHGLPGQGVDAALKEELPTIDIEDESDSHRLQRDPMGGGGVSAEEVKPEDLPF